jgi:hypothetical protein
MQYAKSAASMTLVQHELPTCAARFEQLLDLALCKHVVEQLNCVLGGVGHVESGWDRLQINMLNLNMIPLQAT